MYDQNSPANKLSIQDIKGKRPICIWMTGFSGSGKSTIANLLSRHLSLEGYHNYVLDGDCLREGVNSDLGFNDIDRKESVRRAAEISRLFLDAGVLVIVALISPFRDDRKFARQLFESNEFCEVFIDASIEECILRDTKGLYAKAISGQLLNFTGISSGYEPPEHPDVHVVTASGSPQDGVKKIFDVIKQKFIK